VFRLGLFAWHETTGRLKNTLARWVCGYIRFALILERCAPKLISSEGERKKKGEEKSPEGPKEDEHPDNLNLTF